MRGEEAVAQVGHLHHHLEGAILVSLDQKFTHLRGRGRGEEWREGSYNETSVGLGWAGSACGLPTSLLALK